MTDFDLLDAVLRRHAWFSDQDDGRYLSVKEREAFTEMRHRCADGRELSAKQRAWVHSAAVRIGVLDVAPAANVFSSLSPSEQAAHRKRAASVVLPWEVPGHKKALKPPGVKP